MRRVGILVTLLLSALLSPIATPANAQTEQELQNAALAAQTILTMAGNREFNAMYDLMHPDAMAIVPRGVAVGVFNEIYGAMQAGMPAITGGEIGQWTWGVTGHTYPTTAIVTFSQPYVQNGKTQTLTDTLNLVQDARGNWRWFFGSSPQFVQAAIAKYGLSEQNGDGQQAAAASPLVEGDLIVNAVNDLDAFWRDVLSYTDYTYRSPGVVVVDQGDSVRTACGTAATGFWAFYCPGDATLYLDDALLVQLEQEQPFAAAFVISHEWAHHIQTEVGLERMDAGEEPTQWNQVFSVELELQANCLSGAWAQDLDTRGRLETGDIQDTTSFAMHYLGDPPGVDTYDPQAHGSGEMRVAAITGGYEQGFLACNITV